MLLRSHTASSHHGVQACNGSLHITLSGSHTLQNAAQAVPLRLSRSQLLLQDGTLRRLGCHLQRIQTHNIRGVNSILWAHAAELCLPGCHLHKLHMSTSDCVQYCRAVPSAAGAATLPHCASPCLHHG